MNDIDQYKNLVSILKLALAFYADDKNYKNRGILFSSIDMDCGSQARFTLQQIENLEKFNLSFKEEYEKLGNNTEGFIFNIKSEIEALKNIGNDGND